MGICSPPEPPNPFTTASAQTGQNVTTATANSWLNNVNRVGPEGSTKFGQTGTHKVWDPNMNGEGQGGYRDVPSFTQTTQLSPTGQKIFNQGQNAKLNLAQTASERSKFLQNYLKSPAQYNDLSHTKWSTNLYDKINSPHIGQDRQALESNLANQGIQVGTDAYNSAMGGFNTSQQEARNKFMLDSYGQGESTFRANRASPLNEIIGLMSGSQIQVPNAPEPRQSNMPTTDVAGLIMDKYKSQLQNYQNTMGGLGGLFLGGLNFLRGGGV